MDKLRAASLYFRALARSLRWAATPEVRAHASRWFRLAATG